MLCMEKEVFERYLDETFGRENVKRYLKENPKLLEEVESKVRANFAKAFEESLGEELPSIEEDEE